MKVPALLKEAWQKKKGLLPHAVCKLQLTTTTTLEDTADYYQ